MHKLQSSDQDNNIAKVNKDHITFECGGGGEKTGKRFFRGVEDIECNLYTSDPWKVYEKILPKEKHLATKVETHVIEGFNSTVRHYPRQVSP